MPSAAAKESTTARQRLRRTAYKPFCGERRADQRYASDPTKGTCRSPIPRFGQWPFCSFPGELATADDRDQPICNAEEGQCHACRHGQMKMSRHPQHIMDYGVHLVAGYRNSLLRKYRRTLSQLPLYSSAGDCGSAFWWC